MGIFTGTKTSEGLVFLVDAGNPKSYPGSGSTWYNIGNPKSNGSNSNMAYNSASGGYFQFNNSSSVSTFPNYPELNPTTGLTIESWVNFDGNSDDFIFEKGNVNTQFSLFSHGGDCVFRTFHSGESSYHSQAPSKATVGIVNGQWHHIVGSWDGSTKRIYNNGIVRNSVSKSGALITRTTGAAVGRFGGTTTGYYFGGKIAYVAVYNRGLTADEIASHFNSMRERYGV
jgi:hypothetical protein